MKLLHQYNNFYTFKVGEITRLPTDMILYNGVLNTNRSFYPADILKFSKYLGDDFLTVYGISIKPNIDEHPLRDLFYVFMLES